MLDLIVKTSHYSNLLVKHAPYLTVLWAIVAWASLVLLTPKATLWTWSMLELFPSIWVYEQFKLNKRDLLAIWACTFRSRLYLKWSPQRKIVKGLRAKIRHMPSPSRMNERKEGGLSCFHFSMLISLERLSIHTREPFMVLYSMFEPYPKITLVMSCVAKHPFMYTCFGS